MRWLQRGCATALVCLSGSALAQGGTLSLDVCEAALETWFAAGTDEPFALAENCPALHAEVLAHPFFALLEPAPDTVTLAQARALRTVDEFYAADDGGVALDAAPLGDILSGLSTAPQAPSWFERAMHWIERQLFGEGTALGSWARSVSVDDKVLDGVMYLTGALLVLAAIALVAYEVYLARRHRRQRSAASPWQKPGRQAPPSLDLDAVRAAPGGEQLGLLLRLILERLAARRVLTDGVRLTHRQISVRATEDPALANLAEPLEALARGAEQDQYGPTPTPQDKRAALLKQGTGVAAALTEPAPARRRR